MGERVPAGVMLTGGWLAWPSVATGRAEHHVGDRIPARTRAVIVGMVEATWDGLQAAGHDVVMLRREVDAIRALPYHHP